MIERRKGEVSRKRSDITARDLSRLVRRMSHLFGSGELGNYATSDALGDLAEYLEKLGNVAILDLLDSAPEKRMKKATFEDRDFQNISLNEVEGIISKEDLTKEQLTDLALKRFGIAGGRLNRLSTGRIKEEIMSALGHERSLDYIEDNARRSGRDRKS